MSTRLWDSQFVAWYDRPTPMSNVDQLLHVIESGNQQAAEELLPAVYQELRQLAKARLSGARAGQSLQATDLVHEAYRRVAGDKGDEVKWSCAGHFFGAAAEAMRRILIDRAREKATLKRGGHLQKVEFDELEHPAAKKPERLLEVNDALSKLEVREPRKAELVKLRFFAGLTNRQAAEVLGISVATAERHWAYARAWLKAEIIAENETTDDA